MDAPDTYKILMQKLAGLMERMPRQTALALAAELTTRVNLKIINPTSSPPHRYANEVEQEIAGALPHHLMNRATLTLPWDAFRMAHNDPSQNDNPEDFAPRLVCSLPDSMESSMRVVSSNTGIWSGTILDALASLMGYAKEEIILINPYWSVQGVEALVRRVVRPDFSGVTVTVLTQPRRDHAPEALEALHNFSAMLNARDARCSLLSPPASEHRTPLLHAKALVADRQDAYLGSANFTGSGMDSSVELGIRFGGALARQLHDWLFALSHQLQEW